jgi:hypothetical protein
MFLLSMERVGQVMAVHYCTWGANKCHCVVVCVAHRKEGCSQCTNGDKQFKWAMKHEDDPHYIIHTRASGYTPDPL